MKLKPGQYYPRIGRGGMPFGENPNHLALQSGLQSQLLMLEELNRIFTTVYPDPKNTSAFGHKFRNLLMLACTEFESQCIGILKANAVTEIGNYYNTQDYIKLKDPLKLDKYKLRLRYFPNYPLIKPFQGWSGSNPTASLIWYESYNKTKHNREENFEQASLNNVVLALAGCACIIHAQIRGFSYPESTMFGSGLLQHLLQLKGR